MTYDDVVFGARAATIPFILNEGDRFFCELEPEEGEQPFPPDTEAAFHLAGQVWTGEVVDLPEGGNVLRFEASRAQVADAIAADPEFYTLRSDADTWARGRVFIERDPSLG